MRCARSRRRLLCAGRPCAGTFARTPRVQPRPYGRRLAHSWRQPPLDARRHRRSTRCASSSPLYGERADGCSADSTVPLTACAACRGGYPGSMRARDEAAPRAPLRSYQRTSPRSWRAFTGAVSSRPSFRVASSPNVASGASCHLAPICHVRFRAHRSQSVLGRWPRYVSWSSPHLWGGRATSPRGGPLARVRAQLGCRRRAARPFRGAPHAPSSRSRLR